MRPAAETHPIRTGGLLPKLPAPARVLVVEDNGILGAELCCLCSELGATPVGPVGTLASVKRILAGAPIQAATVDINLGGGCIYTVAEWLADRDVPFIFVSGYTQSNVPDRHAAVPFLQKPAPIDELMRWLRVALAGASAGAAGAAGPAAG